jgi:cellulose synthase (UDP-forming)
MTHSYAGIIKVYCLDDSARDEVRELAEKFGFTYYVRPDRGHFKKAGNLRYGYKHSDGEFIAIFDADFKPRHDFLSELLPYFYLDTSTGIVQSPQYFDVHSRQNWLERGAGAVQELFYRFSQVSRQNFDSAICVGSNAVYRRKALDSVGGTALIEHSEDVHTGFNLRTQGWNLRYIPVILAKGLCPSNMTAFFKQQYRWCRGSMSLLQSKKFWKTKLSFRARLSYFSGFLYYISTAINSLFLPVIPLLVLFFFADKITINHYLLVLPSFIFAFVIFPIWHNAIYGVEAWAVRSVYGWAHLFAVVDTIIGKSMAWKPTGAKVGKDTRYIMFRVMQFIFNFIPSIVWVTLAAERLVVSQNKILYIPLLISGAHYFFVCLKVTLYSKPSEPKPEKRTTKKKNILQSPALS